MGSSFHVLIIDDDSNLREALSRSLVRLGCEVSTAETAEKGVEQIKNGPYDAVFAALCVREMGGRGVARVVKSNSANTKFFLITSWKGELEPGLLRFDGIHDVIRKPINFTEIRDKVLEHLG